MTYPWDFHWLKRPALSPSSCMKDATVPSSFLCPSVGLASVCSCFFLFRGAQNWAKPQYISPVRSRGKGSHPSTCMQWSSQKLLTFFASNRWLVVSLVCTRPPVPSQQSWFSASSEPSMFLPLMFLARVKTLRFVCWTSWGSYDPVCTACPRPSGLSATPHSFVLSADLVRVHSVPVSQSFMTISNSSGSSMNS